eukprot:Skav212846  [mRNA]  locus=scaffold325:143149:143436:- [translate_table: standard]
MFSNVDNIIIHFHVHCVSFIQTLIKCHHPIVTWFPLCTRWTPTFFREIAHLKDLTVRAVQLFLDVGPVLGTQLPQREDDFVHDPTGRAQVSPEVS